jgi:hypothetical protein
MVRHAESLNLPSNILRIKNIDEDEFTTLLKFARQALKSTCPDQVIKLSRVFF